MKLSVSTIALTAYDHGRELPHLAELGLDGVEVAPSRIWRETWRGLRGHDIIAYRRQIEQAGLNVVGLHSLLFDHPELGVFTDSDTRSRTLEFMVHLSSVCRDLGGRSLIWGGKRQRGELSQGGAIERITDFLVELCARVADHETCFCLEPLAPKDSDLVNSVLESLEIVKAVDRPALRIQMDVKALAASNEIRADIFQAVQPYLAHVHANEPDLGILGSSGEMDHAEVGCLLREIGYSGYVSIEQRMVDNSAPLSAIAASTRVLRSCYGSSHRSSPEGN